LDLVLFPCVRVSLRAGSSGLFLLISISSVPGRVPLFFQRGCLCLAIITRHAPPAELLSSCILSPARLLVYADTSANSAVPKYHIVVHNDYPTGCFSYLCNPKVAPYGHPSRPFPKGDFSTATASPPAVTSPPILITNFCCYGGRISTSKFAVGHDCHPRRRHGFIVRNSTTEHRPSIASIETCG
jgi:hypothetical protein